MTQSFWGDLSSIDDFQNPLDLLKEQSDHLLNATNNILFGDIRTRNANINWGEPEVELATTFLIKSKVMDSYEHVLFTMYYNIPFFPFDICVNDNLREALSYPMYLKVKDELEFTETLKIVFNNNYTKNIIKSLYSMSK